MLKSYCKKCGAASTYSSAKPNFCQKCGSSFDGVAKGSTGPSKKRKKKSKIPEAETFAEDEDGDEPQGLYKNLNQLDIDMDFVKKGADTFESLWGTSAGSGGSWADQKEDKQKMNEKDFLEQFQKEAGAIRPMNKDQET